MESGTAAPESTSSRTIADMMSLAAEKHGDRAAVTRKRGDEWAEVSYREVGEIVSEIARGLIDLGGRSRAGRRAAVLCTARPEWTYASFRITSAGGVVVRSTHELARGVRVGRERSSESRFVVCEDASQVAKIAQVQDRLRARGGGRDRPGWRCRRRDLARRPARAHRAAAGAAPPRWRAGRPPSRPRTRTRSSTPRAPPGRPRAACSRTATTARWSTCAETASILTRATSPTSISRWRTHSRC